MIECLALHKGGGEEVVLRTLEAIVTEKGCAAGPLFGSPVN